MLREPRTRPATATGELPAVEIPAPCQLPLDPPAERARHAPSASASELMPILLDTGDPARFDEDTTGEITVIDAMSAITK